MCKHQVIVKGKTEQFGTLVSDGRDRVGMTCIKCGEKYGTKGWSGQVSKWVK